MIDVPKIMRVSDVISASCYLGASPNQDPTKS